MKIQRFNEKSSYTYPITEQKLRKMEELKIEVEEFSDFLSTALEDYLKIHPELQDEYDDFEGVDIRVINHFFLQESEFKYMIYYRTDDYKEDEYNEIVLDDEEFQDLLKYLQDPELYQSTKKYNL
jgi:hypothetical protein